MSEQQAQQLMNQMQMLETYYTQLLQRENSLVNVFHEAQSSVETIKNIENVLKVFSPNFQFDYTYFEEIFNLVYNSERRLGEIIKIFSFLAIFLACLGLFGLASLMANQRTKEFCIRKVVGVIAIETGCP